MPRWIALTPSNHELGRCEATCRTDAELLFRLQYPGCELRAVSVLSWQETLLDIAALERNKRLGFRPDDEEEDGA